MSINALRGMTHSKRDDIEALAYMLIYFLYGKLPWMGLSQSKGESPFSKILKMKEGSTADELCPDCSGIATLLEYSRTLMFDEEPNYAQLVKLLEREMKKKKFEFDGIYDWTESMGRKYLTGALDIDPDD